MAKYKAYPEYKDSGVEWLGDMPKSWEKMSFRFLVNAIRNGSVATQIEYTEESFPISRIETISSGEINMSKVGFVDPKTISNSYKLTRGDLLLSHINSLSMVGNVALKKSDDVLYHGMNLLRIIPNNSIVNGNYLYWVIKSPYCRKMIESIAKPAINQASVSIESLKSIQIIVPKLKEQVKIAFFLQHETAKIDNLIEKQQQLIELLKEKRQAVISHAVTKGLNPDVPMKDSGVEWLGEVPKHWEVSKVKYYCTIKGRIGFRGYTVQDLVDENEGALVLGASEIRNDGSILLNSPQYISWEKYYESPEIMLDKNMILFVQRGSTVGKVSFITHGLGKATINPSLIVLRDLNICGEFMNYSLMSSFIQNTVKMQTSSTAIPMISQEQVGNYFQLIPPLNEQLKIADFIASNVSKIDQAINTAEISISLIKERRTALISAAVTGKIDVRDWVAPDTQDVEEPQEATA